MALIHEDGTGKADAESPNSITELNAYHALLNRSSWTGTDPEKEAWAREASMYLESNYSHRLGGERLTETQALSFPRVGLVRRTGTYAEQLVGHAEVAVEWKRAHAELALRAKTATLQPDLKRGGKVRRVKVGSLEKEFEPGAAGGTSYEFVDAILRPILQPVGILRRA